jgi:hypothetical protein
MAVTFPAPLLANAQEILTRRHHNLTALDCNMPTVFFDSSGVFYSSALLNMNIKITMPPFRPSNVKRSAGIALGEDTP